MHMTCEQDAHAVTTVGCTCTCMWLYARSQITHSGTVVHSSEDVCASSTPHYNVYSVKSGTETTVAAKQNVQLRLHPGTTEAGLKARPGEGSGQCWGWSYPRPKPYGSTYMYMCNCLASASPACEYCFMCVGTLQDFGT